MNLSRLFRYLFPWPEHESDIHAAELRILQSAHERQRLEEQERDLDFRYKLFKKYIDDIIKRHDER